MHKLETILLVLTLSLDAFVASIAYGANKIKIPCSSVFIINLVCSLFLGFSIFLGYGLKQFLPGNLAVILSFTILILLGIYYLLESFIKSYLKKKSQKNKNLKIKLFDIWIFIDIYVDETQADLNQSKNLNFKEAIYLGSTLSLDSLAVGFGSSLGSINYVHVISLSFFIGILALCGGLFIGEKLAQKSKVNLSWLSGMILIALAILKLL